MSGEDVRKELLELRERVVKLEVRVDELVKRVDNQSNYMRQLYDYLQKRTGR